MDDWQWVPWTVAALSVVATSIFGGLNYKHSKRSRGDTLVHQEHSRGLDVLGVARSELGARIEAAKAEIQLAVLTVEHKLDQAHSARGSFMIGISVPRLRVDSQSGHESSDLGMEWRQGGPGPPLRGRRAGRARLAGGRNWRHSRGRQTPLTSQTGVHSVVIWQRSASGSPSLGDDMSRVEIVTA